MHIDFYSFGEMTVNGTAYTRDLIIFPDRIVPEWWRIEGHSLCIADLFEVIDYRPDTLIVGRGAEAAMQIPSETRRALEERKIRLVASDTAQAVISFNEAMKKGSRTAGAFHLTC